jgi:GNAT superfamily N-acetyltransferase
MPPATPRIVEVVHNSPEYRATVAFRQRWLRHPLGLRFTDEELAAESDSVHLACYLHDELVGCVVLKPIGPGEMKPCSPDSSAIGGPAGPRGAEPASHDSLQIPPSADSATGAPLGPMKMRQLVVHPDHQRRGLGAALVRRCEQLARELGHRQITLHARETAVAFYERLGYRREGDRFVEVGIPHWKMSKTLAAKHDGPVGV